MWETAIVSAGVFGLLDLVFNRWLVRTDDAYLNRYRTTFRQPSSKSQQPSVGITSTQRPRQPYPFDDLNLVRNEAPTGTTSQTQQISRQVRHYVQRNRFQLPTRGVLRRESAQLQTPQKLFPQTKQATGIVNNKPCAPNRSLKRQYRRRELIEEQDTELLPRHQAYPIPSIQNETGFTLINNNMTKPTMDNETSLPPRENDVDRTPLFKVPIVNGGLHQPEVSPLLGSLFSKEPRNKQAQESKEEGQVKKPFQLLWKQEGKNEAPIGGLFPELKQRSELFELSQPTSNIKDLFKDSQVKQPLDLLLGKIKSPLDTKDMMSSNSNKQPDQNKLMSLFHNLPAKNDQQKTSPQLKWFFQPSSNTPSLFFPAKSVESKAGSLFNFTPSSLSADSSKPGGLFGSKAPPSSGGLFGTQAPLKQASFGISLFGGESLNTIQK